MTIRVVDSASAAVAADAQLASPVLQWPADTALAAQTDCTRGAVASWDYRYPPRLHSIPKGNDDEFSTAELGWTPFLWRPARRVTSIVVRARLTCYVAPVRVGVHLLRLDDLMRGVPVGEPLQWFDTTFGSEQTAVMAVTGISLEADTTYAVILSARSATDPEGVEGLYNDNTGTPGTALNTWIAPALLADTTSPRDNYWSDDGVAFTAVAEDDRPYLVEIVSGSDPFTATYDASKAGGPLPNGRLLWRVGRAVSNIGTPPGQTGTVWDALWVWPPLLDDPGNVSLGSGDWVRRTPLGYVDLHSVEIIEGVEALPGYGTLLAPERRTSTGAGQASAVYAEHALGQHPRVYACAPSCDYPSGQADPSALGGYDHHAGVRANVDGAWSFDGAGQLVYTGTWVDVAEVVVGHPDTWTPDGGTTELARATYRVTLLVALLADSPPALPSTVAAEVRATVTDITGGSASATVTVDVEMVVSSYAQLHNPALLASAPYNPHWIGFNGSSTNRTPQRHSLRGAWCDSAWRDAASRYTVIELVIPDDGDPTGTDRVLTVEARLGELPGFGTRQAFFLVDGLNVEALRGFGSGVGVEV